MNRQLIIQSACDFLSIRKIEHLAALLGTDPILLKTTALNPEYKTFNIRKKNGGLRKIEAPAPSLKKIQNKLNHYLQCAYNLNKPEFVHGFIIKDDGGACGTGIVSNAKAHISRQRIMTIDIEDFFHSFKAIDVRDLFSDDPFRFPRALANILAMLTTWYDFLPVGAPTSPVFSNLLTRDLDNKLASISSKNNGIYSRYADDMTFSFNDWIADDLKEEIRNTIEGEGFRINNSKFRIQPPNKRQVVTGLVVNEKVNINRKYIRKIRAVLFDWRVNGIDRAARRYYGMTASPEGTVKYRFQRSLEGRINHIGNVRGKEDRIFMNLNKQFKIINSSQD